MGMQENGLLSLLQGPWLSPGASRPFENSHQHKPGCLLRRCGHPTTTGYKKRLCDEHTKRLLRRKLTLIPPQATAFSIPA